MQRVNPTRIELLKLRRKLTILKRGYKLLKDKRDGLMREFMRNVKEVLRLRKELKEKLKSLAKLSVLASGGEDLKMIEKNFSFPFKEIILEAKIKSVMGKKLPEFSFSFKDKTKEKDLFYSLISTNFYFDEFVEKLKETIELMFEVSLKEHALRLLAEEIETTRRRVNALQYKIIPTVEEQIKYIRQKIDEQERSDITIRIKLKSLIGE